MTTYFDKPLDDLSADQLRHLIGVLDAYKSDEAWQFLRSILEREIVAAARAMSAPKPMSSDDMNYRRGAMWAAEQLVSLPERILMQLNNTLLIKEATAKTPNPAEAGKE